DEIEEFEDEDEELAFLLKRFNHLGQRKNFKFKNKEKNYICIVKMINNNQRIEDSIESKQQQQQEDQVHKD
ncbi:hypothetical protein PIB30_108959, partial [Stylosanthes scabra]|nr:hypothetical protein [Stylosanthes scabra]